MKYVIKSSNGKWVRSGYKSPFTSQKDLADRYDSELEAQLECCGNEWPELLWEL